MDMNGLIIWHDWSLVISLSVTLQETNISPKKWQFWRWFSFSRLVGYVNFSGGYYLVVSTNPFQKYAQVKLDHFCRDRGENKTYLSCHHLVEGWHGWIFPAKWKKYFTNLDFPGFPRNPQLHLSQQKRMHKNSPWKRAVTPLFSIYL